MAPTYYCSSCASALGLKAGIDTSNLLGTPYQGGKFGKHTSTSGSSREPVRTVFDSKSTADYAKCIILAIDRGFVELDGQRKNICFPPSTGSALGVKLNWGVEASKPARSSSSPRNVGGDAGGESHATLANSHPDALVRKA
jgi:hypothetical protein